MNRYYELYINYLCLGKNILIFFTRNIHEYSLSYDS
ncbi:MAG: hypothetical protein UZ08_BCD001000408 [Candidatus Parvibacillus calidus]|nr:MAG: hypothetical protein UZ08_BCD001000408 [Candidatus Parvibacillus calidus]